MVQNECQQDERQLSTVNQYPASEVNHPSSYVQSSTSNIQYPCQGMIKYLQPLANSTDLNPTTATLDPGEHF